MRTLAHLVGRRAVAVIDVDRTVLDAARMMREQQVSSLPVVLGGEVVGIVTERDLVQRVVALELGPAETPLGSVMSRDLVCAAPSDTYEAALGRMKHRGIRHLLIVSAGSLVGIVSMRDLLIADAVEKSEEIELLTSFIHSVPPVLPPLDLISEGRRPPRR
jgi:CBS domain-containing protein